MPKPYVIVFSTMTADGKIASKTRFSQLSCPADLKRLHRLRAECGAVMVGANTVIIDDPSLRLKYFEGPNPVRVVVDGRLRSPVNARVFDTRISRTILLTTEAAPAEKVEELRRRGVEVVVFPGGPIIDMKIAMEKLYQLGVRRLLVEGGGTLTWHLFKDGVVDEFRVTIAPFVFGGVESVSIVMGNGFETTEDAVKLKLLNVEVCECGNEVHIAYKVLGSMSAEQKQL